MSPAVAVPAGGGETSIDVARGTAMLLVFLAHFAQELSFGALATGVPLLLQQIAMVAFRIGQLAPAGSLQVRRS